MSSMTNTRLFCWQESIPPVHTPVILLPSYCNTAGSLHARFAMREPVSVNTRGYLLHVADVGLSEHQIIWYRAKKSRSSSNLNIWDKFEAARTSNSVNLEEVFFSSAQRCRANQSEGIRNRMSSGRERQQYAHLPWVTVCCQAPWKVEVSKTFRFSGERQIDQRVTQGLS